MTEKNVLSEGGFDFINDEKLESLLGKEPDASRVREIIAKSMAKVPLEVEETAALVNVRDPELIEEIFAAARKLKVDVYGNRIVLFAPLYIGNRCVNDCRYCGFRVTNREAIRRTLNTSEIEAQVKALERAGHKRLILVFGEHPEYDAKYIADCVNLVSKTKEGCGEIRRVNINAAPFGHDGFRLIKEAGIGTYQIFQESYHHKTYAKWHPAGTRKADYLWRLDSLSRAMEAGCDDVGIGALFGLGDWRFEVLGLVEHARHLDKKYGCGPHTVSFPRMCKASGVDGGELTEVTDNEFKRIVAILRLSIPYTGLILTAREKEELRRELLGFGVSQIDAGSRLELGGYSEMGDMNHQVQEREQFELGDLRSLDEVMRDLLRDGYLPSFCTACYRKGRTGQHFMEFAIPGFIANLCTPNALCTLTEYLNDYGSPESKFAGKALIEAELSKIADGPRKTELKERIERIAKKGERDLYF
jgi:2-iminoacetate synthase